MTMEHTLLLLTMILLLSVGILIGLLFTLFKRIIPKEEAPSFIELISRRFDLLIYSFAYLLIWYLI